MILIFQVSERNKKKKKIHSSNSCKWTIKMDIVKLNFPLNFLAAEKYILWSI